jgi:hypothetical protein
VQVHCDEGIADHIGPEPCAGIREDTGTSPRAVTAASASRIAASYGMGVLGAIQLLLVTCSGQFTHRPGQVFRRGSPILILACGSVTGGPTQVCKGE